MSDWPHHAPPLSCRSARLSSAHCRVHTALHRYGYLSDECGCERSPGHARGRTGNHAQMLSVDLRTWHGRAQRVQRVQHGGARLCLVHAVDVQYAFACHGRVRAGRRCRAEAVAAGSWRSGGAEGGASGWRGLRRGRRRGGGPRRGRTGGLRERMRHSVGMVHSVSEPVEPALQMERGHEQRAGGGRLRGALHGVAFSRPLREKVSELSPTTRQPVLALAPIPWLVRERLVAGVDISPRRKHADSAGKRTCRHVHACRVAARECSSEMGKRTGDTGRCSSCRRWWSAATVQLRHRRADATNGGGSAGVADVARDRARRPCSLGAASGTRGDTHTDTVNIQGPGGSGGGGGVPQNQICASTTSTSLKTSRTQACLRTRSW